MGESVVIMAKKNYTEEFRLEAIRQVTEKGHPASQVADRLGISRKSMYDWLKKDGGVRGIRSIHKLDSAAEENRRLKAELKRVTEERDILKKAAAYFAKTSK
jgi:transposase